MRIFWTHVFNVKVLCNEACQYVSRSVCVSLLYLQNGFKGLYEFLHEVIGLLGYKSDEARFLNKFWFIHKYLCRTPGGALHFKCAAMIVQAISQSTLNAWRRFIP